VWSLPPRALIGNHLLIADGVTPLPAELDAMPPTPQVLRRRRTAAARLPVIAARSDAILVAGPAQMDWWTQQLSYRFGLPLLKVPFGIPEEPAGDGRDEIPGVPPSWAVVLWWGGVWPWLDLETLLAARARLGSAPVSLVVPTARRPGVSASSFGEPELRAAMQRHGLEAPQVVALDRWIPYAERHRVLNRCTLIAVLHRSSDEAALSFRTRALDGVWAGVPLLLSEGGEVARLTRDNGWGAVVPPEDVGAVAAAMELLLGEREQLRCRSKLAACRSDWTWWSVTEPLRRTLSSLPEARRGSLLRAVLAAAVRLLGSPKRETWS
jgi:glycosyltransferase involved in cell wall biosynthesis